MLLDGVTTIVSMVQQWECTKAKNQEVSRRKTCNREYYRCSNSGCTTHLITHFAMGWTQQNVWTLALKLFHAKELMWKAFHFGMMACHS